MGLLKTQSEISKLESDILSQYGEISLDQEEQLDNLHSRISTDIVNSFRFLHAKRPSQIIENIDNRIKDLKAEKKRITRIWEIISFRLHKFLEDNKYSFFTIFDDNGNPEFFAKSDMSVRKSVDSNELNPSEIKYEIVLKTFNIDDIDKVRSFIINNTNVFSITSDQIIPNVSDLSDNHPAIKKHLTPKIKFVKHKPKE